MPLQAENSTDEYWPACAFTSFTQDNGWLIGDASQDYPHIARRYVSQQLGYIQQKFQPKRIMICEFGFPVFGEALKPLEAQLYDQERTIYYRAFIEEALQAHSAGDMDLIRILAWSALDNNEVGTFDTH